MCVYIYIYVYVYSPAERPGGPPPAGRGRRPRGAAPRNIFMSLGDKTYDIYFLGMYIPNTYKSLGIMIFIGDKT